MVNTEILKDIPFFSGFDTEDLATLSGITTLSIYAKGTDILRQGETNECLYFLYQGRVAIFIDEEHIVDLTHIGDLLGEMSVVSHSPCAATVRAVDETICVTLNIENLESLPTSCITHIEKMLYKNYAGILTEKIEITNRKAVLFEETNKKLQTTQLELKNINQDLERKVKERTKKLDQRNHDLERQNIELTASHVEMDELLQKKDATLRKIDELKKIHLQEFAKLLENLRLTDNENQKIYNALTDKIKELDQFLRPMTEEYQNQQSLKSMKVLLVENDVKVKVTAKLALGGVGIAYDIIEDFQELPKKVKEQCYDIFFISTDIIGSAQLIHENCPKAQIVLMTDKSVPQYINDLKELPYVSTVLSRDLNDKNFLIKSIAVTVKKMASQDIFGLEKYLNWGIDVQETTLDSSDQRLEVIEEMNCHLKNLGVRSKYLNDMNTVLEEMMMNAIYDAPLNAEGKSLYNHLSRTEKIQFDGPVRPVVRYACDGVLAAISVIDYYGGLTLETILQYLESCYHGSAGQLNERTGKGGAGRGLHQIIEGSDLVIFNVDPLKKTEVIAFFDLSGNRKAENKNPSFHYFKKLAMS